MAYEANKMCTVNNVAKYLLSFQGEDASDAISNMKLQKLLYYAQGFALAILGRPLFSEDFEAWEYGPVVPSVYKQYKKYGFKAIPPVDINIKKAFKDEEVKLLDQVYNVFGQYSAWALSEMSHNTAPWKETANNSIISKEVMKNYFMTQVTDD